jgi:hypothetical protein
VVAPRFDEDDHLEIADHEAVLRMGRHPQTVGQRLSLALPPRVLNNERRVAELCVLAAECMGRDRNEAENRTRGTFACTGAVKSFRKCQLKQ